MEGVLLIRLGSITLGLSVHVSCIALHSSWLQRSFLFGDCGLRKRPDRVHSNGCTSRFYVDRYVLRMVYPLINSNGMNRRMKLFRS